MLGSGRKSVILGFCDPKADAAGGTMSAKIMALQVQRARAFGDATGLAPCEAEPAFETNV